MLNPSPSLAASTRRHSWDSKSDLASVREIIAVLRRAKIKNKSQSIEFYLSSIISCRSNIEQEWSFISLKILLSHILSVNFIELCFRQINFKFKGISKIAVISFGGNLSNYLCQGVTSAGKHDNWSRCHNSEVFFYFRDTV